jgi:biopolymer transport protein ExbD
MEAPKTVTLPESVVESKPRETVVIFVSRDEILVQGKLVARVKNILEADKAALESITNRLAELEDHVIGRATKTVAGVQEVTILADKEVPFAVIKRIMSACTGQGYGHVSLAVIQKPSRAQAS